MLIGYGVNQLDGSVKTDPVFTADCVPYTITPDEPITRPFGLGGAIDPSKPEASFFRALFADPLHLPSGRWQIFALTSIDEGSTCTASPTDLRASIQIDVISGDAPIPSPQSLSCGNDMMLVDHTGLVAGCESQVFVEAEPGVTVAGNQITAQWYGAMCQPVVSGSFSASEGGLILAMTQTSGPYPSDAPSCAGGPMQRALSLTLNAPMHVIVRATINGEELPTLASPPESSPAATAPRVRHDDHFDRHDRSRRFVYRRGR